MLLLAAQTETCEGRVMCYSKYYETAHHQLPGTVVARPNYLLI